MVGQLCRDAGLRMDPVHDHMDMGMGSSLWATKSVSCPLKAKGFQALACAAADHLFGMGLRPAPMTGCNNRPAIRACGPWRCPPPQL